MKRTGVLLLALSTWFAFSAWGQNPAIHGQGTTNVPMKTARSDASLQWKNEGGKQVLRLWKLEGADEYPQISVLRVSNSDYLKFSQDPKGFMKFVNEHHVFSKEVIVAGPWVSLSSVDQKDEPPDWVLTLVHGKMSTMIVAALPQLKQEGAGSKMQ